jgi:hypothetical protein
MATLAEIEKLTREYAQARRVLAERVQELENAINELKRKALPYIRRAAEAASERQAVLKIAIEESPELFQKPRTVIFHGVKVGFQKGKGELKWESAEQVVRLIKKHFPEQAETLIKVKETPVKTALAQLSVQELKKIGVEVNETGDEVVIKSTDSEIDKLVAALLKEDEVKETKEVA